MEEGLRCLSKAKRSVSDLESMISKSLDMAVNIPGLYDLDINTLSRIISRIPKINIETAKTLVKNVYVKHGIEAVSIIAHIECGQIGAFASDVLKPFLQIPLLRELVQADADSKIAHIQKQVIELQESFKNSKSSSETNWEDLYRKQSVRLEQLEKVLNVEKDKKLRIDIVEAIQAADEASIRAIVANDPSILKKKIDGMTPLHHSIAFFGRPDVVNLLIDLGADVDMTDSEGKTPLMYAVTFGSLEKAQILLRMGAMLGPMDKNVLLI